MRVENLIVLGITPVARKENVNVNRDRKGNSDNSEGNEGQNKKLE